MNRVMLVGNLARDPELSTTPSGVNVCRFTIAVQRRFTNAEGQREADFLPVIAWRGLADNCHKYLRKGSKAGVVGSIQTRSYDANDGTKRYVTEIIADNVEFCDSRPDGARPRNDNPPPPSEPPAGYGQQAPGGFTEVDDDELPF